MYARELADTVWRGRRFAEFLPETVLHDELSDFQEADACSVQESFLLEALCHLDRSHKGLAQEALELLGEGVIEVQRDPRLSQDDREQLCYIWSEFRGQVLNLKKK